MGILKELFARIPEGDIEKRARVKRAHADFFWFCEYYLPHIFTLPFADCHREAIGVLNWRRLNVLIAFPREHGKTNIFGVAFSLWSILTEREKFLVFVGSSAEQAEEQLSTIKQELENNERIVEDFGDQRTGIWRQDNLELRNGCKLMARGAGCSIRGLVKRGQRPTRIILDDLEKDQTVMSRRLRNKLVDWIKRVIMPLGKTCRIAFLGTIIHRDSVLKRFIDEYSSSSKWFVRKYAAILPNGRPLWPEKWTIEELEAAKVQMGSAAFATEFMNEPMDEGERMFPTEIARFKIRPAHLSIVMAIDPATGKAHGDPTGLVIGGREQATGNVYILEAKEHRGGVSSLCEEVIHLNSVWNPSVILFESVAFQAIYRATLFQMARQRGVTLPLKGYVPKGAKETRIKSLSPLVENQALLVREGLTAFIDQMTDYPQVPHDDLLDAGEQVVSHLESGEITVVPVAPGSRTPLARFARRSLEFFKGGR